MILPTKYIRIENSLMGIGAELITRLEQPRTISSLWEQMKVVKWVNSYENFILALDFIFLLDLIDFEKGFIRRIEKC